VLARLAGPDASPRRDQVEAVHSAGLKIFPWTINTREEAQRILDLGVDGLICNELRVMQAA
jgi:glycerophosphoryl diester phosphodiesterase